MGKLLESKMTDFGGGIADDPRAAVGFQSISNFNALTNSKRLIPYRDSEGGAAGASDEHEANFCVALGVSSIYKLYALGVVTGTGYARILVKTLTTGGSTDLGDAGWNETANNVDTAGVTAIQLFVYYAKTGLIYGAKSGTHIWAYDPTGVSVFAPTHQALTYTNIAQGIVHSADDRLYIPYDNKIAVNDNGSWSTTGLTLPSHYRVTSICEHGSYLAIACSHLDGVSNSRVFIWDRDTSLSTVSESIDWGEGAIQILENVEGFLIGISQSGGSAGTGGAVNASARFKDKVIFRYLSGSSAIKFKEMLSDTNVDAQLPIAKQKLDNRLYFMMQITLYGTLKQGVWSIGRVPGGQFTLIHERTPDNASSVASWIPKNLILIGDYLFQSYIDNGTYKVSKTNDSLSYTNTSVFQTTVQNDGDSSITKKLVGVSVMTEYLPTNGQIVLKYKKDAETSFTTISTETTDNSISHSAVNIESSGVNLPEYKEITFKVESTGGAVITGLTWKSEVIDKRVY